MTDKPTLTAKQEAFCQAVADGHSQAQAYRMAYDVGADTKQDNVYSRASVLMADDKITARVEELRAALSDKQLWSRVDSVVELVNTLHHHESKATDKISAVKVLNEMHGYNAPTTVNLGGSVDMQWTINVVEAKKQD